MPLLDREDYVEPRCLLNMDAGFGVREDAPRSVPLRRVAEKLDEYCARKDFEGARRHLDFWLEEARQSGDRRGEFSLQNERMGFFRKQGQREAALAAAEAALALLGAAGEDSVAAGTCFVNVGTVYDNFGSPEKALVSFEKARAIYEKQLPAGDERLAGLYNNMGLALAETGRYREAEELFRKALDAAPAWDRAITWLNLADAALAEKGPEAAEEQVQDCLERASALLDEHRAAGDAYYAYVCGRCAPGFDYHGWFAYAQELRERAEDYYAGT